MNTNKKELNLNELEMVNGGTGTPVEQGSNDGVKMIIDIYRKIYEWFTD